MEVEFVSASILRKITDSISELVSEVEFEFTPHALTIQAMDSSHVAILNFYIHKGDTNCFSDYHVPKNATLGINMASFGKAMKMGDSNDSVTLKMKTVDDDVVKIIFQNPDTPVNKTTFNLKLMNLQYDKLAIPDTAYPAVVTMPSTLFRVTVGLLQTIGDTTDITVTDEKALFVTSGDHGKVKKVFGPGEGVSIKMEDDKDGIKLCLALRYLALFAKVGTLASTVRMSMHPGIPVEFYFPVGKPNDKKQYLSYIRFYLAPKIEEDQLS